MTVSHQQTVTPVLSLESNSVQTAAGEHLGYIDGIRAVLAMWVVVGHIWQTIWCASYSRFPEGTLWAVARYFYHGHFAVAIFIVLSGFCLAIPVVANDGNLRGGVKGFLKRRARRILPPYYFSLGVSLIVSLLLLNEKTGTIWDTCIPVTLKSVLAHAVLLHNLVGPSQINYVLWSIAVEWQLYFLFPLLIVAQRRWGAVFVLLITTVVSGVAFFGFEGTRLSGLMPHYAGFFCMGAFGAVVAFDKGRYSVWRFRVPWRALAFCAGVGAVIAMNTVHGGGGGALLIDFLAALCATGVLISLCSGPKAGLLCSVLSSRPLVFVGAFAYSLYLIHAPVIQLVWKCAVRPLRLDSHWELLVLGVIATPLALLAAYGFYLACERPWLNRVSPLRAHA